MLKSHRDTHITYDTHALISQYLDSDPLTSLDIHAYMKTWPGTPGRAAIWNNLELDRLTEDPLHPTLITPKRAMWYHITAEYTPSDKPSHSACAPPDQNKPPPAIRATIDGKNCLITSTIFCLTLTHCFDSGYSEKF